MLSEHVQKAIDQITVESQDKLIDFDQTKEEINQLVKSNTTELQNIKTQFTEAIDKKIKDIKSVAISKEDLNQLKKQFESRFETESANIKKYVASYGGGGGGAAGGGGTGGNQTLIFNETTAALSISNGNTVSLSALQSPSISGTGLVKVVSGDTQLSASLLDDVDVATNANISQSKISGLTAVVDNVNSVYSTVASSSATWGNPFTVEDANTIIGLSIFL